MTLTQPLSITDVAKLMQSLGKNARAASKDLARAGRKEKDTALALIAQGLRARVDELVSENGKDLAAAKQNGLDDAMLDRLAITPKLVEAMAVGCEQVAALSDPVGYIDNVQAQPSGISVGQMRVPLGVIGIVYESRPNVTVDAAILCLKSGNATILRGGSESIHSNRMLGEIIQAACVAAGLPAATVQVVETTDREAVRLLISMPEFVDVVVPRGGKGLVSFIAEHATVPSIKHLDGICHVYLDKAAALDKAHNIALNAKTHRYGVCNAMESLLVHQAVAEKVLPNLFAAYLEAGVVLKVCEETRQLMAKHPLISEKLEIATEEDWGTEYLSPMLSIKLVASMADAIEHIERYGSHHTDTIVTQDHSRAMQFMREVDSASVMVNASTRFADGFEYGLGAEIGISTDKLHARGPVGLIGLTSQKFIVLGDGHIRE